MLYIIKLTSPTVSGMVYPAFGIVFSKGIGAFSSLDPHQRRHDGDRVALWFFIIAVISMILSLLQTYMFVSTAATLTAKLRSLSFRAILRQDSESYHTRIGDEAVIFGHTFPS